MVKRVRPDGTATVYVGSVEYELTTGGAITTTTSYYAVPGARVVRNGTGVFWVLTDHLGSSSVTLDDSGSVVGELRYFAYGATRVKIGSLPSNRQFTGQMRDDESGLDSFNARWLSSSIAKFISADSIVPSLMNPQSLNRYSYASGGRGEMPDTHLAILSAMQTQRVIVPLPLQQILPSVELV